MIRSSGSRRSGKKSKKKMTIKPFKVQPKLSESFETDTIDKLMNAVEAVFDKRATTVSLEELYKACQSLVTLKKGAMTYDRLRSLCDRRIHECVERLDLNGRSDIEFLREIRTLWEDHNEFMQTIRQIFLMLDRTYVKLETAERSIHAMGLMSLRHHCCNQVTIQARTVQGLLGVIQGEREGDETDRLLCRSVVRFVLNMKWYREVFEKALVGSSHDFYSREAMDLIERLSVPDYLNHVMERLVQEKDRVNTYLHHSTRKQLQQVVKAEMIGEKVRTIIHTGFDGILSAHLFDDLRHMYRLLQSVDQLEPLAKAFLDYILHHGREIMNRPDSDESFVQDILEFQNRCDSAVEQSFDFHADFKKANRKGWEVFINEKKTRPALLIASFVDEQLRTGAKGITETEFESRLDKVMEVFRFIHSKDVFQAFYQKHLGKRLLLNKSCSEDVEQGMIARIRKECGQTFASNLESMFKDMHNSVDLQLGFNQHMEDVQVDEDAVLEEGSVEEILSRIDFNVQVLTSSVWPSYETDTITLPADIVPLLDKYKEYYLVKNSRRKLRWTSHLSHATVAGNFPAGRKELVCSAFQATILMLFNQSVKMTYEDLSRQSGIETKYLKATLLSLITSNIIQKKRRGANVIETDVFRLNKKFQSNLRRIKVNAIQVEETKEEQKDTTRHVMIDRQYQIDACVVRTMKARKTLRHTELMTEVLGQLRFDGEVKQIKKRIEHLINNEYLERDPDDSTLYHYKA